MLEHDANEVVALPRQSLREVVRWAYYASAYERAVSFERLRALGEPIAGLLDEIRRRDEERQSAGYLSPFESI